MYHPTLADLLGRRRTYYERDGLAGFYNAYQYEWYRFIHGKGFIFDSTSKTPGQARRCSR